MACSCPQCTARPTDREAYSTNGRDNSVYPAEREDAVFHPTLGPRPPRRRAGRGRDMEPPRVSSIRRSARAAASGWEPRANSNSSGSTNDSRSRTPPKCRSVGFATSRRSFPIPRIPASSSCSARPAAARLISPRHVLTAGHVILNDFTLSTGATARIQASRAIAYTRPQRRRSRRRPRRASSSS